MGSDILSYWGVSKWGEARWACYQATWGHGVWGESLWGFIWTDNFFESLKIMEKVNIGSYCFEAGCVEPGCDNVDVPLRRILSNMEK